MKDENLIHAEMINVITALKTCMHVAKAVIDFLEC